MQIVDKLLVVAGFDHHVDKLLGRLGGVAYGENLADRPNALKLLLRQQKLLAAGAGAVRLLVSVPFTGTATTRTPGTTSSASAFAALSLTGSST